MKWSRTRIPPSSRHVTAAQFLLGDFEYAALRAVRRLGDGAYGASIARELSIELKRDVALAQVYVALDRLEEKGFVSSQMSNSTPVRGGRARRVYLMDTRGLQALEITAAAVRAARSASNTKDHANGRQKTTGIAVAR